MLYIVYITSIYNYYIVKVSWLFRYFTVPLDLLFFFHFYSTHIKYILCAGG